MRDRRVAAAPAETHRTRRSRLSRQRQVVTTLSRHGFGLIVQRSPVPLPGLSQLRGKPENLRAALEELGTTFIKLGQILSTRSDILPDHYIAALSTLQDHLPSVSEAEVRRTIVQELGAEPEALFARFDPTPLATASIGQVHAVTLHGGAEAVIKVQKPGIAEEVALDLSILRDLAHLAADRIDVPVLRNLEEVVEHFSDGLRDELDYVREGQHADRFRVLIGTEMRVRVPRIHWDYTTSRVLTMERFSGAKVTDLAEMARLGIDRVTLARDLAALVLRQIWEWGFFHADPHPGNYLIAGDGTIGLVDFGMVGTLDDATRRDLLLLLASWVKGDAEGVADSLISLGVAHSGTQLSMLRMDMRRVLARYRDMHLGEIDMARVLNDLFRLARRHNLVLRGDLLLMAKTIAMHEGIGLVLDPQFRLVEAAQPFVETAIRRLYTPRVDPRSAALNLATLLNLTLDFPQRAQRLLGRVERGDLGITVRPEGLDPVMRDLNRMVNRLSVSILAAAFIVGLAILLQVVQASHGSLPLLAFFAAGLFSAATTGLWLLISMYRAGRSR